MLDGDDGGTGPADYPALFGADGADAAAFNAAASLEARPTRCAETQRTPTVTLRARGG
jgi:hypothetical protein